MLHPGLAEVCRRKVEKLTAALNKEELRSEAAEILRSTIQAIRLVPEQGELAIELVGELAGILALSKDESPGLLGQGRDVNAWLRGQDLNQRNPALA